MGPLFRLRCRQIVETEFRKRGYSRRQISRASSLTNENTIEAAMTLSAVSEDDVPEEPVEGDRPLLGAIGDFFRSIAAWFRTPEGQAFLKKLFELLLSFLIGMASVEVLSAEDELAVTQAFDAAAGTVDYGPETETEV